MLALPLLLAAGGGYVWVTGGRYQETDNANLQQAVVTIAAQIAGRVVETNVVDNGMVKAGDILFVVDPQPSKIALEQADAALAAARIAVEQLRANYSQAIAQQHMAANEVTYMQAEYDRQKDLSAKGISSRALLDEAQRNIAKAQDQEQAAQEAVTGALAALGGKADIETDSHPSVLAAQAARDKAAYDLAQTTVRAPADGMISQAASFKLGELGQREHAAVQPGRDRRGVGGGEFQGNAAHQHETRPDRRDRARHLSRPADQGDRRGDRRRHRRGVLAAAGAERHRQLGEGHASAFRCVSRSTRPPIWRCAPA